MNLAVNTENVQGFRLSPQQKRIWLLSQQSCAYQCKIVVLLEGKLKPERLREALQSLVDQYEILRTTFKSAVGIKTPVQVISDYATLTLHTIDLRNKLASERSTTLEKIFRSQGFRATDYKQPSLLSATLFVCSQVEHVLLLGLPALCADAATMRNLISALARSYCDTAPEQSGEEPVQYADLAEWQNELLEDPDTVAGRDFWRLKDYSALTHSRPPRLRREHADGKLAFEPGVQQIEIGTELARRVSEKAAVAGVEAAAYYFGCWQVLMWRMAGESPLVCGLYCNGREDKELRQVLGPLARWVPVECRLRGDLTVLELTHGVHEQMGEARLWVDYFSWEHFGLTSQTTETPLPSSSLFASPSPTPAIASLSHCALSFEESDEDVVLEEDGVRFTLLRQEAYTEPFDIKLQLNRRAAEQLSIELHYDAHRFSGEEMKLLAGRYTRVVQTAVEDESLEIQAADLIGAEERRMIEGWNETEISYGKVRTLAEMLASQARKTPDAAAVAFESQQLTYAEINRRANSLAHYLKRKGIGPDVAVGLFVERSLEMIVGLLGILKAGGAYVPLDPAIPKTRLAYQLDDVAAPLLLTQEKLLSKLPNCRAQVLCLDRDQALFANEPSTDPEEFNDPQQLAYVIYTSGSSGAPKGVAVTHRSVFNYTNHLSKTLQTMTGPSAGPLQFATVSTIAADLGNTCLFTSLASGGCLHIISHEVATDGLQFAEYCAQHEIDVLKIVPSHLNALLSSEEHAGLLPRRYLILGGEALAPALLERVMRLAPYCRVINHYGPTETTIGSLMFDAETYASSPWQTSTVPIGRPIANTSVYILNGRLERVPVGVTGQLYIGGVGLARGYVHQPKLTAERFIPDPFSVDPGARLYTTGDQAKYLPDGNIEFLGRLDHQVKIRGFRVELGEIETALRMHPDVQAAVVIVWDDTSGDKRLVAYIVALKETLSISELRHFLQNDLPEHMIPSGIVFLKDLPLTPNGKIDRRALPAYDWRRPEQEHSFVGPANTIEAVLSQVWSEILGLEQVGVHDNFFELGGDSILSIQIAARAGRVGLRFAPMDIFRWPTIAALAPKVELTPDFSSGDLTVDGHAPLTSPELTEREASRYPLSSAQQGILFHCLYSPNSGMYTSQVSYTLSREFDAHAFIRAWQRIVDRHSIFRTAFIWEGLDDPVQVAFEHVPLPIKEDDWRELSSADQEARLKALLEEERLRDFDFAVAPLLRFALIRRSDDAYHFVWTYHHLLMDGWSETLVLDELAALYRAFSRHQELQLEPAPPFSNYIAWLQRQDLKGAEIYWRRTLKGFTAPTVFKARPPPEVLSYAEASAGAQLIRLPEEITRAVTRTARENQLTLNILAQGIWGYLLSYFSGEDDVVFGATVSGRPADLPAVERMVGMFINTLPVRVKIKPGEPFVALLHNLQHQQAEMLCYEFSPLVQVQTWSDILRGMSLFETILVFQNTPGSAKAAPTPEGQRKVVINNAQFHEGKTNFALSVDVEPGAELSLNISYNRQRFEASFITSLLEGFEILLRAFASDPQTRLDELRAALDQAARRRQIKQEEELKRASLAKLERIPRRAARAALAREQI